MVTYLPIASPFVRLSGFWVDDALSFAMGWNYFFLMGRSLLLRRVQFFPLSLTGLTGSSLAFSTIAFSIPYEITAINVLLTYWTDKIPVAAVVMVCLLIYACGLSPFPKLP